MRISDADALPYRDRLAFLATHAHTAPPATLLRGDRYERWCAVFMAVVARHREVLGTAVHDKDPAIAGMALDAWIALGQADADALWSLLSDAPSQTRLRVYRTVRASARADVADVLIDRVRERFGDREAAALLPATGEATVRRLLPDLGYALGNWAALVRRHPAAALDDAERQLHEFDERGRMIWWGRAGRGLLAAGQGHSSRVLELLERFGPDSYLPGELTAYGVLAKADPVRTLRLLTAPGRAAWLLRLRLPDALLDRFARLSDEELAPLARAVRENERVLARLLDAVAPTRRVALYEAAFEGVDRGQHRPADVLLDALPHWARTGEARRILALGDVRADEQLTLEYRSYLPWPEAEESLVTAARRAEPEERARGWELLVGCALRSRDADAVRAVLGHLTRLRNEQDPVRSRALTALSKVRPSLIWPASAQDLERISTDAVQARDISYHTRHSLGALAVGVLREHTGSPELLRWSLTAIEKLYGQASVPLLGRLDQHLRRGQEDEVFAAIRPWIEAGMKRDEHGLLFGFTQSLGRRAWHLDALQDLLARTISRVNVGSVVQQAIRLWLAPPATRSTRVETVLRFDESTVAIDEVWQVISATRTDLLDVVFSRRGPVGQFIAKGVRWVPPATRHTVRWLPRHQKAYVDLLSTIARDASAYQWARVSAIRAAAGVPGYGWPVVERFVGSADPVLDEAALAALPWTDRPAEALPLLLAQMDTDRARVATYAAGRAARFVAPSTLYTALAEYTLSRGKVTSRKEAIRLLSRMAVPGAGEVLLAAYRQEGQHRDVRAAAVSTARQRLDSPSSWTVLASVSGREDAREMLAAQPLGIAPSYRPRYASLVATACDSADTEVARLAWWALPNWAQWLDDPGGRVVARLADLDDRLAWPNVVATVPALVQAGLAGTVVDDACAALVRADDADPGDDRERDRPARRRIESLVQALVSWTRSARPGVDLSGLVVAGRRLAAFDGYVREGALLLVAAATVDDVGERLAEAADVLADRPVAASRVAEEVAGRPEQHWRWEPALLLDLATALSNRGDVASGLFAAALARQGARYGWPDEWRALVRGLRGHTVPDVRTAALDITVAPSSR